MKITPKKVKKLLLIIGAILVVLYIWEYHCVTRPIGQCGSFCEKRVQFLGRFGDKDINGYSCIPWYKGYQK